MLRQKINPRDTQYTTTDELQYINDRVRGLDTQAQLAWLQNYRKVCNQRTVWNRVSSLAVVSHLNMLIKQAQK